MTSCAVRWGTPWTDQVFHQGRGVEEPLVEPRGDPVGAERRAVDDDGGQLQAGLDRVEGVEERLLVLLEVAVVGQGQPLDQDQQRGQVADHAGGPAPDQLQDVGVLLLGHDAAAGADRVGQRQEGELLGAPEDPLLGPAREVLGDQRSGRRPTRARSRGRSRRRGCWPPRRRTRAPARPDRGRSAASCRPARPRPGAGRSAACGNRPARSRSRASFST